jgi:excisionase family DNA binding protein
MLGLVSTIVLSVQHLRARRRCRSPPHERDAPWQPNPAARPHPPITNYLHTAEVADLLHVSPKTVSRWAKEGKLPFLKTLGGHRRYPEAEIRELAEGLREEATA